MMPSQEEHSTNPVPYRTSDTPYAAFLHYSGVKLITTLQDPNDYKREVLVFMFQEEIPQLEKVWRLGEAKGDLKKFHRSLKIVNRAINEARKRRGE
jgi:hypothetical protein